MTTDGLSWVPADVDLSRPSAARIYDCLLGGGCNFEVDRQFVAKVEQALPNIREAAVQNRAFLRRAVRYCAEQGVKQFLDLGAGIPTVSPTHEVAAKVNPDSKVVYVDNEAVAVAHGRLLLQDNENTSMLQADICAPEAVLAAPECQRLLDFDEPVAVMMLALVHFIPNTSDVATIVSGYRDALAPDSHLLLSHATNEGLSREQATEAAAQYAQTATPMQLRTHADTLAFFAGFEMVDPGLVFAPRWRPDDDRQESAEDAADTERSPLLVGVGRRTG